MSGATLEFAVETAWGIRYGFLPGLTDAQVAAFTGPKSEGVIHSREVVADHLEPLPLCWVMEGRQRGASVDEWEVSIDHEALPPFVVVDVRRLVNCRDCNEWIHA